MSIQLSRRIEKIEEHVGRDGDPPIVVILRRFWDAPSGPADNLYALPNGGSLEILVVQGTLSLADRKALVARAVAEIAREQATVPAVPEGTPALALAGGDGRPTHPDCPLCRRERRR
jgi:hypothetical protein